MFEDFRTAVIQGDSNGFIVAHRNESGIRQNRARVFVKPDDGRVVRPVRRTLSAKVVSRKDDTDHLVRPRDEHLPAPVILEIKTLQSRLGTGDKSFVGQGGVFICPSHCMAKAAHAEQKQLDCSFHGMSGGFDVCLRCGGVAK